MLWASLLTPTLCKVFDSLEDGDVFKGNVFPDTLSVLLGEFLMHTLPIANEYWTARVISRSRVNMDLLRLG
jgi:hypothetical protein